MSDDANRALPAAMRWARRESSRGAARHAAYAAGQAAAVAHVAAHELGAAAYAIKAVARPRHRRTSEGAGRRECAWQREQLPSAIRELVLDDQRHAQRHLLVGVRGLTGWAYQARSVRRECQRDGL